MMNAEDQIRNLKQILPLSNEEKRKKIKTSIVLTMATLISVLFLMYAFVKKLEAEKQTKIATKQRELAIQNFKKAQAAREEAEKQRALAEEALAACEKSKKK